MSIHAVSWALRQELPPVPKFVLVALCERANGKTGQCWPGIDEVAEAVCLSKRSVITYIAALVRNGYVMKQPMRRKNGQKANNHYWICFDREPAPWVGPGTQVEELPAAEGDEIEASETAENAESPPCADFAHGDEVQPASPGPGATACTNTESLEEPESFKPEPSPQVRTTPPADLPPGFQPSQRLAEQDRIKAAEEARRPKKLPVILGSKYWDAWVKHGHKPGLVGNIEVNGRRDRGWYFPTLYPPKAGAPPDPESPLPDAKKAS